MEYIYPAFERGRIMKKELLEALRDYSYLGWWLRYQEYSDGIIKGCSLTTDESSIFISPGIIKCNKFIFLIRQPESVEYQPAEKFVSLKFRIEHMENLTDYNRYETAFILDETLGRAENEIELCRFKLKKGSRLRYEYRDFYDIQTEFDTLNMVNGTWSGKGENTLSKAVTDYFAKEVLKCSGAEWQDVQFAYMCLQNEDAISIELLQHYICSKQKRQNREDMDVNEIFLALEEILKGIRLGRKFFGRNVTEVSRTIIVD